MLKVFRQCYWLPTILFGLLFMVGCSNAFKWGGNSSGIGGSERDVAYSETSNSSVDMNGSPALNSNGYEEGGYYVVAEGDTLYSIAFRYNQDFREVAQRNNIAPPYIIQPGERIQIAFDGGGSVVGSNTADQYESGSKNPAYEDQVVVSRPASPVVVPESTPASVPPSAPVPVYEPPAERVGSQNEQVPASLPKNVSQPWRWPTDGKVSTAFQVSPRTKNGMHIAGKLGQSVYAANAGQVVYVGNSLKGYGNLIILKHDEEFISAYGFNDRVLVAKNDWVFSGQMIASMGADATTNAERQNSTGVLHFEIRQNGKPVNPLNFLN